MNTTIQHGYFRSYLIKALKSKDIRIINSKRIHKCTNNTLIEEYIKAFTIHPKVDILNRRKTIGDKDKNYVYFIGNLEHKLCKIGYSSNIKNRLKNIQVGFPYILSVLGYIEGTLETEKDLHKQFTYNKLYGEWFKIDSTLETFIKNNKND